MELLSLYIPQNASMAAYFDAYAAQVVTPTFRAKRFFQTVSSNVTGTAGESYLVNAPTLEVAKDMVRATTKAKGAFIMITPSAAMIAEAMQKPTLRGFLICEPTMKAGTYDARNILDDDGEREKLTFFFDEQKAVAKGSPAPFTLSRTAIKSFLQRPDGIQVYCPLNLN